MKTWLEMSEEERRALLKEFAFATGQAAQVLMKTLNEAAAQIAKVVPLLFQGFVDAGMIDADKFLREEKKLRHRRKYYRMMERKKKT